MAAVLQTAVAFAVEPYSPELLEDIRPLLDEHWREVAHYPDIPLAPRWEVYAETAARGALRIYTARVDGVLVGYSVHVVAPALHYGTTLTATEDLVFVAPPYRRSRLGWGLITFADEQLRDEGVQVAYRHVKQKPELDFSPLLERMGYEQIDRIMGRRLDKEAR
jgi:GNAT superfamily N-acetyltransferase